MIVRLHRYFDYHNLSLYDNYYQTIDDNFVFKIILEPKMALCGNGVVEEGEECDCGWEEDCEEECCWPQRTDYPKGQKPCTLRPNKPCSPTQVIK